MHEIILLLTAILIVGLVCLAVILVRKKQTTFIEAETNRDQFIFDQIYIGNLPYRVDEGDLKAYFSKFGKILGIKVIRNFKTGRSKGYAFITFSHAKEASKALVCNGREIQGRLMIVRVAKVKQQIFENDHSNHESLEGYESESI